MPRKIFKALFGVTILALPAYVLRFNIGPIPTTVLELTIYLAFLFFLVSRSYKNIRVIFPIYIGAVFSIAGLIGALIDPNLASGLGIWKAYFFDGFLVLLMALSIRKEDIVAYLQIFVATGLLTSAIAFFKMSLGISSSDGRLLDLDRLSPNYLAMFLVPAAVCAIALAKEFYRKNQVWIVYLASFSIMGYAIYLTGSRGGYVALIAGGVTILFAHFMRGKKAITYKVLLVASLLVLLAGTYLIFKPDWTSHERKATSSNVRYYIWTTSLEMISHQPVFGVGLSNYQNYFSDLTKNRVNYPEFITPQALTAHNLYLQIYLTTGLLGLISFVVLVAQTRFWRFKSIALSASLVSILIFGLFDTPFYKNDLAVVFWLIIAFLYLGGADLKKNA